ncbi:MAG: SpoIIE family protein phosphatase, partial [Calditrichales bacterium]|nr:SpoIIE family protein phosphatase [Calditrichales bacterium]
DKEKQAMQLEQDKKDALLAERAKRQLIIRNSFIVGFILVLIIGLVVFRSFIQKRKANRILSYQKAEIEAMNDELHQQNEEIVSINEVLNEQKEIIENKNIQITDSINYAQHIQESVFLSEKEINDYFTDSFVLNIPKDIVSGDFFWFHKVDDKNIFAVVDCTGHGVPGAFMSLIGNSLLTETVKENKITEPSEILNVLHNGVIRVLRQDTVNSKTNDGMDMVICTYDEKTKELYFSGARNIMYVLNGGDTEIINGDFFSIGEKPYFDDQEVKFTTQKIEIAEGSRIYLMTDGYMDQFGGPENKKFNQIPFEKMLTEISDLPMKEQKEKMLQAFKDWKGSNRQIDDVMVLGIKLC